MAVVTFKGYGISIEVEDGAKLSDCIRKAGLSIETPCNCIGICGKCKVKASGELSPITAEEKLFDFKDKNIRLACMTRVLGPVEIEILSGEAELKTINRGISINVDINSGIKKVILPSFDRRSSKPYCEGLDYSISSSELYNRIAEVDKSSVTEINGVIYGNTLLDIGNIEHLLGVAIDIGTTGISAYLVNMETGEVLNRVSCLNPQTEFGGDVLSRIAFCMNNTDGREMLKKSIIEKINEIIGELVYKNYNRDSVYRITVAGNTTMLHLLLGIDPMTIAKSPYRPLFLDTINMKAREIGIKTNLEGLLTVLPSASGYVGADIISGVVATAFDRKKDGAVFIDIGTNGEIVGVFNGSMAATSTAAGPALEGMNISCGQRAEYGAIDSFSIDDEFNIKYSTIGNTEPRGICGSGLIDIASSFVEKGIILKSGKLNSGADERIRWRIRDKKFYITENIYISQRDIRQIQLAKGAIASGVAMLLNEIGTGIEDVREVVIAGAFGYHINPESIKNIGIIPKGFKGEITFVGNSSVEGARLALVNEEILCQMSELRNRINVLELSTREAFQEYFVRELNF